MPVCFVKCITPLPVGVWGRKETKPSFAEVPPLSQASFNPGPYSTSIWRSKIVLSLDLTSLSSLGIKQLSPAEKNSVKSTTTNSGAGRLQEQVSVTPSGVFASTPVCGHRAGIRDPNFSSVIYALRKFNKAYVKKEDIFINVRPQVGGHAAAVDTNKSLITIRNKMRNLTRSPFSSLL